jgi:non-homologous end joining protein Ku
MAKQKAAGQELSLPSAPKRGKVIDLMSALKDSLKSRGKKDGAKDSEDEDAQDDRVADRKDVRRAAGSSRHPQSRRRTRS